MYMWNTAFGGRPELNRPEIDHPGAFRAVNARLACAYAEDGQEQNPQHHAQREPQDVLPVIPHNPTPFRGGPTAVSTRRSTGGIIANLSDSVNRKTSYAPPSPSTGDGGAVFRIRYGIMHRRSCCPPDGPRLSGVQAEEMRIRIRRKPLPHLRGRLFSSLIGKVQQNGCGHGSWNLSPHACFHPL